MYISRIVISNIRSLEKVEWSIAPAQAPGWHVIIGDNGSGKSTFLQSAAVALMGAWQVLYLRLNWNNWLRQGTDEAIVALQVVVDTDFDLSAQTFSSKHVTLPAEIRLSRKFSTEAPDSSTVILSEETIKNVVSVFMWRPKSGFFSASYGPYRRFSGGIADDKRVFERYPLLSAHLSIFGEGVALAESLEWLRELKFKELESDKEATILLDNVKRFVNQNDFLPNRTRLTNVSSAGVEFVDGNGCAVPVEDLSDGYRSILSMTFELIRQMTKAYGDRPIFSADGTKIDVPGVVLIDEVDAHLHPSWQRRIGLWFREHFPKVQFIVTTHSPLVCQAADVGTVWKLPRPGSGETGGMVTGVELDRLLYGNILDAYGTEMFGHVTRSEHSQEMLTRLAELNVLEMERDLSDEEAQEQERLRAMLPTSASAVTAGNGVR